MLGTNYKEIKQQGYEPSVYEYRGYIAENFVQQELTAIGIDPSYSWNDARAEIELLLTNEEGNVMPLYYVQFLPEKW